MGPEAMGIQQIQVSMWDAQCCKAYVAGTCTHDLFTNTKMDLGACPKTHSQKVKAEFEEEVKRATDADDQERLRQLNRIRAEYESEIIQFVEECDRRIRAAQRRLEKTPEENNKTTALMREIGEIETALQGVMTDVEQLGSEGKVDESMAQLAKAEALKSEKSDKERELQQLIENQGASGHQKLRVCDICGAYLSILDSDRRLADHFGGKMHLGYHQLRVLIDEWKQRGPLPLGPPPSASTTAPTTTNGTASHQSNGHAYPSSRSGPPPPAMSPGGMSGFVPASAGSPPHHSSGSDSRRRHAADDDRHSSSRYSTSDRDGGSGSSRRRPYDDQDSGRRSYDDKRRRVD